MLQHQKGRLIWLREVTFNIRNNRKPRTTKIRANTSLCLKRFDKTAKKRNLGHPFGAGSCSRRLHGWTQLIASDSKIRTKVAKEKKLVMFKDKPKFKPKTWVNWTNWWKTNRNGKKKKKNGSKIPVLVWIDCTNYSCTSIPVEKIKVSYQCPPAGKS